MKEYLLDELIRSKCTCTRCGSEDGIIVLKEHRDRVFFEKVEGDWNNDTIKARIIQLEEEVLYWKEAHLDLQRQVLRMKEKANRSTPLQPDPDGIDDGMYED